MVSIKMYDCGREHSPVDETELLWPVLLLTKAGPEEDACPNIRFLAFNVLL